MTNQATNNNNLPHFPDWIATACGTISMLMLIGCVLWAMSSCSPQKYCQRHGYYEQTGTDTAVKELIKVRDSLVPFYVASDSGYLEAYLECVNDYIRLSSVNTTPGKIVTPSVVIKDNIIRVKCKVDSFAVYSVWKNKEVYKSLNSSQTYVKVTNELTGWQHFWIRTGKILSLSLIALIAGRYGLKKLKTYLK